MDRLATMHSVSVTERQITDRQTYRQTDRQTDRHYDANDRS